MFGFLLPNPVLSPSTYVVLLFFGWGQSEWSVGGSWLNTLWGYVDTKIEPSEHRMPKNELLCKGQGLIINVLSTSTEEFAVDSEIMWKQPQMQVS